MAKKAQGPPKARDLEGVVGKLGKQLASAQAQLVEQAAEQAVEMERLELVMPRALRSRVKRDGTTKIQRIGEKRTPLSTVIAPGAFQVTRATVELPVQVSDGEFVEDPGATGTLKMEYDFVPLTNVPTSTVIDIPPVVEVTIEEFERSAASGSVSTGYVQIFDGESGRPLADEPVFLELSEGTISPSVGTLDSDGKLRIGIRAPCGRVLKLDTTLMAVVRGRDCGVRIRLEAGPETGDE